jgi:hypothetical protein
LRCIGLKQAVLSNDGTAVLLELSMANGKIFPLELDSAGVASLTGALLVSAQALGEAQPPRQALESVAPAEAVAIPVKAVQARSQPDGSAALLLRAGSLDLIASLPDRAALAAMLEALQRPAS